MLNSRGQILIQKRSNDAPKNPGLYCFPGGGIEEDESPNQAVRREIYEETGVVIGEIYKMFDFIYHQDGRFKTNRFYLCHKNFDPARCTEGQMFWMTKQELKAVDLALQEEVIIPYLETFVVALL